MHETGHEKQLISYWEQDCWDWRESIFAPHICIIEAVTVVGKTASGLGDTRDDALQRCLSETAEIMARRALSSEPSKRVSVGQTGIAAHVDPEYAQLNALYEAHERVAIWQWWLGQGSARKIPDGWLLLHGFTGWLDQKRATAEIKRVTALWSLTTTSDIHTVVCKSEYPNGQDPILGFGSSACVFDAARKALRETLLMELNLMEVLAVRSGYSTRDVSTIEAKIKNYALRCPAILPQEEVSLRKQALGNMRLKEVVSKAVCSPKFRNITPPDQYRVVWQCCIEGTLQLHANGPAAPFM
jgi:hypothetical protein